MNFFVRLVQEESFVTSVSLDVRLAWYMYAHNNILSLAVKQDFKPHLGTRPVNPITGSDAYMPTTLLPLSHRNSHGRPRTFQHKTQQFAMPINIFLAQGSSCVGGLECVVEWIGEGEITNGWWGKSHQDEGCRLLSGWSLHSKQASQMTWHHGFMLYRWPPGPLSSVIAIVNCHQHSLAPKHPEYMKFKVKVASERNQLSQTVWTDELRQSDSKEHPPH